MLKIKGCVYLQYSGADFKLQYSYSDHKYTIHMSTCTNLTLLKHIYSRLRGGSLASWPLLVSPLQSEVGALLREYARNGAQKHAKACTKASRSTCKVCRGLPRRHACFSQYASSTTKRGTVCSGVGGTCKAQRSAQL